MLSQCLQHSDPGVHLVLVGGGAVVVPVGRGYLEGVGAADERGTSWKQYGDEGVVHTLPYPLHQRGY